MEIKKVAIMALLILTAVLQLIYGFTCTNVYAETASALPTAPPAVSEIKVLPPKLVGLDDDVTLNVAQLGNLVKTSASSGQQIILFLNGMPIKKIYADSIDPNKNELRFRLKRTEESKDAWNKLLGSPMLYWNRPTAISVGLENQQPLASSATIDLVIVKRKGLFFWVAMAVIILFLLLKYGRTSAALRTYHAESPYSLAQVQMAAWFFLVISSYVFIWLVTGDMNNMPESILLLMGISTGTTLGARIIDQRKLDTSLPKLKDELTLVDAKLKEFKGLPDDSEATLRKQELEDQRSTIKDKIEPRSKGLWNDIISDSYGTSLHRLQAVMWTIVFGLIFCYKVYQDLAMPEFNPTLLTLMGISSATYLGLKIPEK